MSRAPYRSSPDPPPDPTRGWFIVLRIEIDDGCYSYNAFWFDSTVEAVIAFAYAFYRCLLNPRMSLGVDYGPRSTHPSQWGTTTSGAANAPSSATDQEE